MKRIFSYLRGTTHVGLIYRNDSNWLVTSYSDSDYAGDVTVGGLCIYSWLFFLVGRQLCWLQLLIYY